MESSGRAVERLFNGFLYFHGLKMMKRNTEGLVIETNCDINLVDSEEKLICSIYTVLDKLK